MTVVRNEDCDSMWKLGNKKKEGSNREISPEQFFEAIGNILTQKLPLQYLCANQNKTYPIVFIILYIGIWPNIYMNLFFLNMRFDCKLIITYFWSKFFEHDI